MKFDARPIWSRGHESGSCYPTPLRPLHPSSSATLRAIEIAAIRLGCVHPIYSVPAPSGLKADHRKFELFYRNRFQPATIITWFLIMQKEFSSFFAPGSAGPSCVADRGRLSSGILYSVLIHYEYYGLY
jgi:hypothetical protein